MRLSCEAMLHDHSMIEAIIYYNGLFFEVFSGFQWLLVVFTG